MFCIIFAFIPLLILEFAVNRNGGQQDEVAHDPSEGFHAYGHKYHEANLQPALLFEINRHGARAPFWRDQRALKGFGVAREMLTPSGMRQRSLLGNYNMMKYQSFLHGYQKYRVLIEEAEGRKLATRKHNTKSHMRPHIMKTVVEKPLLGNVVHLPGVISGGGEYYTQSTDVYRTI